MCHQHTSSRSLGVQCSIDGSVLKGLHVNIGHNWTYRWPHGSSFGLLNFGSGKGNIFCLDRAPTALRCYWLIHWFFFGFLCPVSISLWWLLMQIPLELMQRVLLHQVKLYIPPLLIWCFWFHLQILYYCLHGRWIYQPWGFRISNPIRGRAYTRNNWPQRDILLVYLRQPIGHWCIGPFGIYHLVGFSLIPDSAFIFFMILISLFLCLLVGSVGIGL